MAKKSKTQRAKASAARAARKEQARAAEQAAEEQKLAAENAAESETTKKGLFKKKVEKAETPAPSKQAKPAAKKAEKKPAKKKRFAFLKDVRSEMHRVTWPTKQDVLRWSGVVVVALLFFGVFVAVLDNVIITPILVGISSLSGLGA